MMYVTGGLAPWRVRLHPSHVNQAKALLRRHGMELKVVERVAMAGPVETKGRGRTHVRVVMDEPMKVFSVWDNEVQKRVTFFAVDTLWSLIKEKGSLTPRAAWFELAERHRLFPELGEIKGIMEWADEHGCEAMRGDRLHVLRSFLDRAKTNMFEGLRRTGNNPDELTYYSLWWYPLLILERCGLAGESGNRYAHVTEEGRKTKDWLPKAKSVFGDTLEEASRP